MRIGLISDTHIPINARRLPPQLADVFAGVELILHGGDIYLISVLDELEMLAPVLAAYGDGDARTHIKLDADPRLKRSHIVNVDGVSIGLVHRFGLPGASVERIFKCPVDVVVCGHTHEPSVKTCGGAMVVNPGSATLPGHQVNRLGTVGLLDIVDGEVEARIVQLE